MPNIPDEDALLAIERNLHELIHSRAAQLIEKHAIPLPSLVAMREGDATAQFHPTRMVPHVWYFRVMGMCGGFSCRWLSESKLEVTSFSRVSDGSGQVHEITADGTVLVKSGLPV